MSTKFRASLVARPIRRAKYHTRGQAARHFLCPHCLKFKQVIRRAMLSTPGVYIESYACKVCQRKVNRYIQHRLHVQRLARKI